MQFNDGSSYEKSMGVWSALIGNHFIDYNTKNIKEKMTDDEFEKEMKSFLNSNPQENEPEDKGGDETETDEI